MTAAIRWSSFIGLFGLLAIAASAAPEKSGKQATKPHSIAHVPSQQTRSVEHVLRDTPSDIGCPQGYENRKSDLCAQWKAADAAKSAADATWVFGALGTLIGAFTFAAAWSAAKWAKKAAEYTAQSVIEAKRSADASEEAMQTAMNAYEMQIRPYVAITAIDEEDARPFSRETILKFAIRNFGQVPATNVRLSLGEATRREPIGDFIIPFGDKFGDYGLLAPGDVRIERIDTKRLTPSEIGELASSDMKLLARLRVDYTWLDGSDSHDLSMILDNPSTNEWHILDQRRREQETE